MHAQSSSGGPLRGRQNGREDAVQSWCFAGEIVPVLWWDFSVANAYLLTFLCLLNSLVKLIIM